MGLTAALVPPPAVTMDTVGPEGTAIAEAMQRHLTQSSPGAAPGGARPVILVVEPGPEGLTGLAERIAAAARTRGQRVWVVVTQPAQVSEVDDIVDGNASIDALILVDNSHPATAGAALAAWTWLRHDAPSMALGSLRDSSGRVCRVATVTAQVPAEPPGVLTSAPAASFGRVDEVWLRGLAHARSLGDEVSVAMLGDSDVAHVVGALEGVVVERIDPTAAQLIDEVPDWSAGELNRLLESAAGLAEATAPDEASLASAALAVGNADAALAHENARTGLSGVFGRRKRVAALAQAREQAWEQWCATVTAQGELLAERRYAQQLVSALPELISECELRWQHAAAQRAAEALDGWLASTTAAVARLQPPLPSISATVPRTWGDARPEVRRHLLVPAKAAAALADEYDAVAVHSADGLPQPLALAWLLGLSAASFAPVDA